MVSLFLKKYCNNKIIHVYLNGIHVNQPLFYVSYNKELKSHDVGLEIILSLNVIAIKHRIEMGNNLRDKMITTGFGPSSSENSAMTIISDSSCVLFDCLCQGLVTLNVG